MAINFPSTAGQATDGTFTYVVAGITYSWNGESWSAAGGGATATDRTVFSATNAAASGGGSLAYDSNNGVFTLTPPDLSPYLTTTGNLNTHIDVNHGVPNDGDVLAWNQANLKWENTGHSSLLHYVYIIHSFWMFVNRFYLFNLSRKMGGFKRRTLAHGARMCTRVLVGNGTRSEDVYHFL